MNRINTHILSKDKLKIDLSIHEVGSPLWLFVVHGLGEHKGRHEYLYDLLGEDMNIAMLDLRGHGKSEGSRSDIHNFNDFLDDIELSLNFLQENFKMKNFILMGHSMGGLITTRFLQEKPFNPLALFLSSPALGISGPLNTVFKKLSNRFAQKLASLKKGFYLGGTLDLKKLSHNYQTYKDYIKDPLNSLKTNTRLLFKIIRETQKAGEKASEIETKVYGAIGSGDVFVSFNDCVDFFKKIDREAHLKIIKDGYHELHNETQEYRNEYISFLKETLLSYRYEK